MRIYLGEQLSQNHHIQQQIPIQGRRGQTMTLTALKSSDQLVDDQFLGKQLETTIHTQCYVRIPFTYVDIHTHASTHAQTHMHRQTDKQQHSNTYKLASIRTFGLSFPLPPPLILSLLKRFFLVVGVVSTVTGGDDISFVDLLGVSV